MRKRLIWLDGARGFALINMVMYHAIFDLVYLYDVNIPWYQSSLGYFWQQGTCWLFILISGMSWSLGHHQKKRGLTLMFWGIVISLGSSLLIPEMAIHFGILFFLGISMLLLIPLAPLLRKIPPPLGVVASFLAFILLKQLGVGDQGENLISSLSVSNLPVIYGLAFLGFPDKMFSSLDYFSLFPWFFLYITGFFLWQSWKEGPVLDFLDSLRFPGLAWLGCHSLSVYLLHQPILLALFWLLL